MPPVLFFETLEADWELAVHKLVATKKRKKTLKKRLWLDQRKVLVIKEVKPYIQSSFLGEENVVSYYWLRR